LIHNQEIIIVWDAVAVERVNQTDAKVMEDAAQAVATV